MKIEFLDDETEPAVIDFGFYVLEANKVLFGPFFSRELAQHALAESFIIKDVIGGGLPSKVSDGVKLIPGDPKKSVAGVTEIDYRISFQEQLAGTAKVSYVKSDQVAFIENIKINPELRRQGIGSKAVAWLVLHTPYVVGTRCEWESAYEFWGEMRKIHGDRMLPAPK